MDQRRNQRRDERIDQRMDRFSVGGLADASRAEVGPRGLCEKRFMRLLGLTITDADPVTIITAAQLSLRRWRRTSDGGSRQPRLAAARIRQITKARDMLLRQALPLMGDPAAGPGK